MTKKPFVMIVEDDEWMARSVVQTLAAAGIQAKFVPHALAAIDSIDSKMPDALILDVLLPGPNVFTLLHELKSHADLGAIPIILCTSMADQLVDEDMAAYGVRRVLDKTTMRPGDLVAAVKKVLI